MRPRGSSFVSAGLTDHARGFATNAERASRTAAARIRAARQRPRGTLEQKTEPRAAPLLHVSSTTHAPPDPARASIHCSTYKCPSLVQQSAPDRPVARIPNTRADFCAPAGSANHRINGGQRWDARARFCSMQSGSRPPRHQVSSSLENLHDRQKLAHFFVDPVVPFGLGCRFLDGPLARAPHRLRVWGWLEWCGGFGRHRRLGRRGWHRRIRRHGRRGRHGRRSPGRSLQVAA